MQRNNRNMRPKNVAVFIIIQVLIIISGLKIDILECGIDHEVEVRTGEVPIDTYPWLGFLYYLYDDMYGENRAVTTVALIHREFVIGAAADIGPMPKHNFRANTRVLLGDGWNQLGRRVRNYIIHPEYKQTYNTLALVQLKDIVRDGSIRPLCPAPDLLRSPEFYLVKFNGDYDNPQKEVIRMAHVPAAMCKDFYVMANLYTKKFRPPHVVCTVSLETDSVCVWDAGGVLVTRDVWGRWQLLGVLTRGPGCGAPSRYLDMLSYYPWVHASLDNFQRLTITRLNQHSYVLRSSQSSFQRFGACDPEEKVKLVYRDTIVMRTDNLRKSQYVQYNMSIYEDLEMTCLTMELINASASSEMRITHMCPRSPMNEKTGYASPCHVYKGSSFHISVYLMFSEKCLFEMKLFGEKKNMTLIDIMDWKWEEATYYHDFTMSRVEYRGPSFMTLYGYEPLDANVWVPNYDLWTTTERDNSSWSSTTAPPMREVEDSNDTDFSNTRPTTTKRRKIPRKTGPTTSTTTAPRLYRTIWTPRNYTNETLDLPEAFWRSLHMYVSQVARTTSDVFRWTAALYNVTVTETNVTEMWQWFVPQNMTIDNTSWLYWAYGGLGSGRRGPPAGHWFYDRWQLFKDYTAEGAMIIGEATMEAAKIAAEWLGQQLSSGWASASDYLADRWSRPWVRPWSGGWFGR